jgi:hypothetical protein
MLNQDAEFTRGVAVLQLQGRRSACCTYNNFSRVKS